MTPGARRSWLPTATNKAIDQHRARARRPVPLDQLPEPRPEASPDHEDLAGAVGELPDKQRLAISLHYLAGLPYALVAEEIGGTPAAARRAAADGIARLRTRIDSSGGPR